MKNSLLHIKLTLMQQRLAVYSVLDFDEKVESKKDLIYTLGHITFLIYEIENFVNTIESMYDSVVLEVAGERFNTLEEDEDFVDIYDLLGCYFGGDMRGDLKPLSEELQYFINNTYDTIQSGSEDFLSGVVGFNVGTSDRQIKRMEVIEQLGSWNEWISELQELINNKQPLSKILKLLK